MSRIFITGSADGLGLMAGRLLAQEGHSVVLHARNEARARDTKAALPLAETVVVGDVSTMAAMVSVAGQVNALGNFDAVIHNVALGDKERKKVLTADGLPQLFAVNSLAPYVLTALILRPARLVYLTSGLHRQGDETLNDLLWERRRWNGYQAYCDSKLQDVLLAFAVARQWKNVRSNAVDPGWVATKMGGSHAPDGLEEGSLTQAWLAAGADPAAIISGSLFYHQQPRLAHPAAQRIEVQEKFMAECARLSGLVLPRE